MTIEVIVPDLDARMRVREYAKENGLTWERLDATTMNVEVPDKEVDAISDFCDTGKLQWRLI